VTVPDPTLLVCKDVVELVSEFLGESMAPADRARIEQHLLVCPPCTLHVAHVKSLVNRLRELRMGGTTAQVGPSLIEAFRQWKKRIPQ
jgi:anti-sigma factor RsiW